MRQATSVDLDRLMASQLSESERGALAQALYDTVRGEVIPFVALDYQRVGRGASRVERGQVRSTPGLSPTAHLGEIVSVSVSKDGNLFFRLRDYARGDGERPTGWTHIRPEGVIAFSYQGKKERRVPAWTGRREG